MKKLTIVVPALNEATVLPTTIQRLVGIEQKLIKKHLLAPQSNILIVDDGSSDQTWNIIQQAHQTQPVCGLKFSRNFGHQNALVAGMKTAIQTADLVVTIDADLQDDPEKITEMVKQFSQGAEIVLGVRNNRDTDRWFKRTSANCFYKLLNLIGVKLIPNHADFRLMSKRAVLAFLAYQERNLFIRGLIPLLGFKTSKVDYRRTPRLAGQSKYPLTKMLAFAWDGITSFSIAPVKIILLFGGLASFLGIIMFLYSLITKLLGLTIHGWSSLMISIWVLGGLQMLSLGILGEYLGKITLEVKHRPRYLIEAYLK